MVRNLDSEPTISEQAAEAIAEFLAISNANGFDVESFVSLHNRYPPEVQAQLRFAAQIRVLQASERTQESVGEVRSELKCQRADLDAARLTAAFSTAISVLAILIVAEIDVLAAIAGAFASAWAAYFAQMALSALLHKKDEV